MDHIFTLEEGMAAFEAAKNPLNFKILLSAT
jgi:hypothetical protein